MRTRAWRLTRDTAGMTLLETLSYVAALGVFINVCAVGFVQASRLSQLGETTLLSLDTIDAIQRDFSDVVHHAIRIEASMGPFTTSDTQVVFRMANDDTAPGATRFIVFGRRDEQRVQKTLYRLAGNDLELGRHVTYPVDFNVVHFTFPADTPSKSRSVTLDLRLYKDRLDNRTGSGARVTAALRALGEETP